MHADLRDLDLDRHRLFCNPACLVSLELLHRNVIVLVRGISVEKQGSAYNSVSF